MTRHRRLIGLMTLAMGLTACGQVDENEDFRSWDFEPGESAIGDTPVETSFEETPVEPSKTSAIAGCQVDPIWWSGDSTHRVSSPHFDWTPDGLAIVAGSHPFGSGSRAWRGRDGRVLFEHSGLSFGDVTTDMSRVLTTQRDGDESRLVILDWKTRQPVWEHTSPNNPSAVAMTSDGSRVATMTCDNETSADGGDVTIEIHDVEANRVIHTKTIEQFGCSWWTTYGPRVMMFSDDGRHLAVGLTTDPHGGNDDRSQPIGLLISDTSGVFETHRWELPVNRTARHDAQIASLSFDPSGSRLTFVSSTGEALEIDTASATIVSREARGAFASNYDTYLPRMPASPSDWTRAGDVEAFVDTDGAVILRGPDGVSLARLLAAEKSDLANWNMDTEVDNPPVSIAFSPNDDMVAIAFRKGMGVWGCRDADDGLPGPDVSELGGPEIAATWTDGQYPSLVVSVTPSGRPTGFVAGQRLYVDGERVASAELGEAMRHHSRSPTFSLYVEVDDGARIVRSETLTVRNPR